MKVEPDPGPVPPNVLPWLALVSQRLVMARGARRNGDSYAVCNHGRAAAEAVCSAALARYGMEGGELHAMIQKVRAGSFPSRPPEDVSHALDRLRNDGNLGSHARAVEAEEIERAARRVLDDLPVVIRWLLKGPLGGADARPAAALPPEVAASVLALAALAGPRRPRRALWGASLVAAGAVAVLVTGAAGRRGRDVVTGLRELRPEGGAAEGPCEMVPDGDFHLRPRETCEAEGPELRASAPLACVAPGTLLRNGTRMLKVRLRDGREGWVFARRGELRGALPAAWTDLRGGVPCRQPPGRNGCQSSMVSLGGRFEMGRDRGLPAEGPGHAVTLSRFCLDRTEVSVGQYRACVAAGGCSAATLDGVRLGSVTGSCSAGLAGDNDLLPINCVTWHQAKRFCEWAGGRLPTEAEWELAAHDPPAGAARGPRANVCGAECARQFPDLTRLPGHADDFPSLAPVSSLPAGRTARGFDDLFGNVAEWTADGVGAYPAGAVSDPQGDPAAARRVVRGGSWRLSDPAELTATARGEARPSHASPAIGFRCASRR
jgi:sulfatase modifying factor 1